MRISTRFLAAASLTALSLFAGGAMAEEKLVIGTEGAYPPFNSLEADGSLTGFDIDIAKALCEEMKVTCTFKTNDWDGIIPALQAKKFDAIVASMSITPSVWKRWISPRNTTILLQPSPCRRIRLPRASKT